MALITISELMEQRRKEIHGEASDDHWLADTGMDSYSYNPHAMPWYLDTEHVLK